MTHLARLRGRSVQVLKPSAGGSGPNRWQALIRIPASALRRQLKPVLGKAQSGFQYYWKAGGHSYRVRIHDADPSVMPTPTNPNPNARVGWVVRVSRGRRYMDPEGVFHPASKLRPRGRDFDEFLANETHIPIIPPVAFP